MDSMGAFARGTASRHETPMVFDWVTAARILRESKAVRASAGLRDDWEYTGGDILADSLPVQREDTYTYLASTWATPELAYQTEDGQEFLVDCFKMKPELPGHDADTYWPAEAMAEFGIIDGVSENITDQQMVDKTRRVVCAAMRHPTVKELIVCGPRHHDKSMHTILSQIDDTLNDVKWDQGFVNTWGEFLTREEAWEVACENNQIFRLCGPQTQDDIGKTGVKLYSENLY